MTDIARVRDGVVGFANANVLPHLPQKQQFLAGMAIGLASAKAENMLTVAAGNPAVKMLGVVNGREVDTDALYAAAKDQIRKLGVLEIDIPIIGTLRFNEADLDALYQHIQQGG